VAEIELSETEKIGQIEARLDVVEAGVQSGALVPYEDWDTLEAVTGEDGDGALVPEDAGTHTDPITSATVDNAGVYRYVEGAGVLPDGWKRIGDSEAVSAKDQAVLASHFANDDTDVQVPGQSDTAARGAKYWSGISSAGALVITTNLSAINTVSANVGAITDCATHMASIIAAPTAAATIAAASGQLIALAPVVFDGTAFGDGYAGSTNTGDVAANALWYVGTSAVAQPLSSLSAFIGVVGSGALDLIIMTGTLGVGPTLTNKAEVHLPAVALPNQYKTFTAAECGTTSLAAGDHVFLRVPTGGAQIKYATGTGRNNYVKTSPAAYSFGGTVTFTQNANQSLRAYFNVPVKVLAVDAPHLAPAVQAELALVDSVTGVGTIKTGYQASAAPGTPVSFAANNGYVVGQAAKAGALASVGTYVFTVNSAQPRLIVGNAPAGVLNGFIIKSNTLLPAPTVTGLKVWTAADFGALDLAVGDVVCIYSPSGGFASTYFASVGATVNFTSTAPGIVGTAYPIGSTSPGNAMAAFFTQVGSVISIPDTSLSQATQDKLALLPSASAAPTEFVVFLAIGQSNMNGHGNSGLSPAIPAGRAYQYYSGALTAITGDPVGAALSGGSIPAFINEFYARTGMGVIIVPCAYDSSSLTAAASITGANNWSSTGNLRAAAITALNAAKAAAVTANLMHRFGGVLFCQGETDAIGIDGSLITKANYKTEFGLLLAYFEAQLGYTAGIMPVVISRTGRNSGGDTTGYSQIRAAQVEFAQTYPNVFIGFTGPLNFTARGLMIDTLHYTQAGYNEMGKALGVVAASVAVGRA